MRKNNRTLSTLPSYAEIMLALLPVGTALFDARELRLLAANPCFHTLLDPAWQSERAIGHTLSEFIPHVEESRSIDVFHQVAKTGIPYQIDTYISSAFARGTTYWNWSLEPHVNADGQVAYLLLTTTDITDRVLAQQAAEKTRVALEAEHERMVLLETITQRIGGLLQPESIANNALAVLTDFLSPVASGMYATDNAQQCFHALKLNIPENEDVFRHHISFVPYDRSSLLIQALQEPHPILQPVRAAIDNNLWQRSLAQILPEAKTLLCLPLWSNNLCEGVLLLGFSQTPEEVALLVKAVEGCAPLLAQALASARLHTVIQQEQRRLHTILDQLPEGILLVEATTGTISYANPTASSLLGIPSSDLIGASLNQLKYKSTRTDPSTFPWHFALINALWGKTVSSQELVIRRPDGSQLILLSSTAPIRLDIGGSITEAVIAFQDITTQKTSEQKKIDFLTMVNHELRTPLTAVLGFSDILRDQGLDGLNSMQTTAISSIVEQSDYLHYLVDEILDQSYLEQTTFELHQNQQDLLSLFQKHFEHFSSINTKHRYDFQIVGMRLPIKLMGSFDADRMLQAFNNVLTNATKYSPIGSSIEIGISPLNAEKPAEQGILLWVKDEGPGIAPDDVPHIFERFYRAKKRDDTVGGLGLGLYLAKELIQSHNGRIWAESCEGVGTTIFLALPFISQYHHH